MGISRNFGALALTVAATAAVAAVVPSTGAAGATEKATLYVVQGLPDTEVDVAVDGRTVASGLEGATVTDAIRLRPGAHELSFSAGGDPLVERTLTVEAGDSTDAVLHLQVDPTADPVVTLFDNSGDAVPADKASVTVTHTAAVPPADIRVNGDVLFANVANGESLNLVVPTGTYSVDIVPTGKTRPVVLGPLDLTVEGGSLNRVFAVGDPESDDMRVVVQVLDLADTGSDTPSMVDTGTGGQAVGSSPAAGARWYARTAWW